MQTSGKSEIEYLRITITHASATQRRAEQELIAIKEKHAAEILAIKRKIAEIDETTDTAAHLAVRSNLSWAPQMAYMLLALYGMLELFQQMMM